MRELMPWLRLILQRPIRLWVGALLIFATIVSGMGLLGLSGWFITETALTGLLLAAGVQASINLYTPGGGIRLFALTRTVGRYLERLYNHDTVLRQLTDIRVRLFSGLALAPGSRRRELSGAQWLSRLTRDVDALDTLYLRLIAPSAVAVLITLLVLAVTAGLFGLAPTFWLALLLFSALLVATLGTLARTRKTAQSQSDNEDRLRIAVMEHLEGIGELTAAGRTGKHGAWLLRQAHGYSRKQARIDRRLGWNQALSQLLVNLAAVFLLWVGLGLLETGAVSGPLVVMAPIALLGLAEVYTVLPEAFGRFGATEAAAGRLNQMTQRVAAEGAGPSDALGSAKSPALPQGTALIAEELAVKYDKAAPLFTHLNLRIACGERVGIVGQSGSGKSTLADALAGLTAPFQGQIARQPVSYLTQSTVLFEDTLRANLQLGDPTATDMALWRVLELVELAHRFRHEPDQLDTWLGSSGSRLSGGEARRVALARVLLSPSPLIILDEPFTGVDAGTRERICRKMEGWLSGKTLVALAHGPDALPGTDRVIHLIA